MTCWLMFSPKRAARRRVREKRSGTMSVVLLDTTVVSLLHPKKRGSEILDRYAVHMEKQTLALSFQSVAEALELGRKQGVG